MEKTTSVLIGVIFILAITAVILKGGITGSAVMSYCSNAPKIESFEVIGDTLSIDWKDTSTHLGNMRYELLIFKQKEDGTYDMDNPFFENSYEENMVSISDVDQPGTYKVEVRAKNSRKCITEYTKYETAEVVKEN